MNRSLDENRLRAFKAHFDAEENRGPIAFVAVLSEEMPGEYGLGIAVANERGYSPVSAAWALFDSMDTAERESDRINAALGLSALEAFKIVASTMGGKLYQAGADQ